MNQANYIIFGLLDKQGNLQFQEKLIEEILSHFDTHSRRFIYVDVSFEKKFDQGSGHANLVLIDNKNKTIERFEPHGYSSRHVPIVINEIINLLFGMKPDFRGYRFLPFTQTNLNESLQSLENLEADEKGINAERGEILGYCYPWCMFYLHMRIANPDIPAKKLLFKLVDEIEEIDKHSKINFIRSYAKNLMFLYPKNLGI